MKIEVINPSTNEVIEIYSISALSRFDFQEWKGDDDVIIHMKCLSDRVKKLDSKDPVTKEPISNPTEADFYLPDPIKKGVFSKFASLQAEAEESSEQFIEKITTPTLKSSAILTAVVTEILHNHQQRSDYIVKISDG